MTCENPTKLKIGEELDYLMNFNNLYVGHLNSVFNFFVVFSALVINALAFVLKEAASLPSYLDEAIILFSLLISLLFLLLDRRTRQIVSHLETSILEVETKNMNSSTKYLRDMPKPHFWSLVRHSVLFPMIYLSFGALMISLIFVV